MLLIHPVAQFAVADHFHVERLARQIHERDFSGAILRLDVLLNALGFCLHHAHQCHARRLDLSFVVALEERDHLLARKLGVDGQLAIGKIDDGVGASSTLTRRRLQREHMRRQEVGEQPLQAGFPELAAQMRKFKQVVQIVDRVAQSADFAKLLFRGLQVLLNFFELGKSFLDVLIEFLLHLLGDCHQLRVHTVANRVETLRGLLIQTLKFALELLRGEQQRTRHLRAAVAQAPVLFFPARGELLLDRAADL